MHLVLLEVSCHQINGVKGQKNVPYSYHIAVLWISHDAVQV